MDVALINAFIDACRKVFGEFNIKFSTGKPHLKDSPTLDGKVSILIGLTGNIRGQVFFNMEESIALKIAGKMMIGVEVNELNEITRSAIGELFNIVLGNAATAFFNQGRKVEITPPSMLFGDKVTISSSKGKILCIPLELNLGGEMHIDLALSEE